MTTRRIIGLVLLTAALMLGAADAWRSSFPSYGSELLTVGRLWLMVSDTSLSFAESLIQHHLWSPLWDFGVSPILVAPAWTVCAVLGSLFFVFGRPQVADR